MSDDTPGSTGAEVTDEVLPDDVVAEDELDLQLDEPLADDSAEAAVAPVRRRTTAAPVRKARTQTSDDAVIADLESDLPTDKGSVDTATRRTQAPVKRDQAVAKSGKGRVDHVEDPYHAKNPIQFAKQSASELKRVIWPTWNELSQYFVVVLAFVLFFILIVGLLDLGFGAALLKLFGGSN